MRLSETVKQTVLPSGITVITDYYDRPADDHRRDLMGAAIVSHTGSLHDPDGKNGLAHLSEHMIAHGIPGMTGKQFKEEIDSLGLFRYNLSTAAQHTRYWATGHTADVQRYLGLITTAMGQLDYGQDSLGAEKGRIINEMENGLIQPSRMRTFLTHQAAFLNRPHSKWTGGLPKELAGIELDEIKDHHQRVHAPENLTLVTSGGWNHEEACEWADRHLSVLPGGTRSPNLSSKFHYPRHMFFYAPYHTSPHTGPMVSFSLHYPTTHLNIPDLVSLDVVNKIVSSDRLYSHAERNQTYALDVGDSQDGYTDQIGVELSGSAIRAGKLRAELTGNLATLRDSIENLDAGSFEREKAIAVRNSQHGYKTDIADPIRRYNSILGAYLSGRPTDSWEQRVDSFPGLNLEKAKKVALQVYDRPPLVLYTAASDDLDFPSSHTLYMAWKGRSGSAHQNQFHAAQATNGNPLTEQNVSVGSPKGTAPAP